MPLILTISGTVTDFLLLALINATVLFLTDVILILPALTGALAPSVTLLTVVVDMVSPSVPDNPDPPVSGAFVTVTVHCLVIPP